METEPGIHTSAVIVGRTDDDSFVIAYGLGGPRGSNSINIRIYDRYGNVISRTDLPAEPQTFSHAPEPWWYEPGQLIPLPPVFFAAIYSLHDLGDRQWEWKPLVHLLLVSAFYVAIAFAMLRASHANRGRMVLWILIAASMGLPGIWLMMSMWEKPGSACCVRCRKRRLFTESTCVSCGTQAEAPAMEGIKILGPALCGAY